MSSKRITDSEIIDALLERENAEARAALRDTADAEPQTAEALDLWFQALSGLQGEKSRMDGMTDRIVHRVMIQIRAGETAGEQRASRFGVRFGWQRSLAATAVMACAALLVVTVALQPGTRSGKDAPLRGLPAIPTETISQSTLPEGGSLLAKVIVMKDAHTAVIKSANGPIRLSQPARIRVKNGTVIIDHQ